MFPGADESSGNERVWHSSDAVPGIQCGVVAVQSFTSLCAKVTSHNIQFVPRCHCLAAHPLGRHIAHFSPLVVLAAELISRAR